MLAKATKFYKQKCCFLTFFCPADESFFVTDVGVLTIETFLIERKARV